MGVVKRVPSDFSWPLGVVWHGYENPWPGPVACYLCKASGLNPASKRIFDSFKSWAPKLTKEESKALLETGVTPVEILKIKQRAKGSDTPLLRRTLSEIRGKRKGVWGDCLQCKGEGYIPNPNPAVATLYEGVDLFMEWRQTEPPVGEGWQVWDDPEGMPISPVFKTAKELALWCDRELEDQDVGPWEEWVLQFSEVPIVETREPFRIQSDHFKLYTHKTTSLD